jgi:hypothetical protein
MMRHITYWRKDFNVLLAFLRIPFWNKNKKIRKERECRYPFSAG